MFPLYTVAKTGVCTLDDETVYHSLIDLSKTKDPSERRAVMRQMIQSRIKNNNPDLVVIEDVALQASAKTVIQLAQLQGATSLLNTNVVKRMADCWTIRILEMLYMTEL